MGFRKGENLKFLHAIRNMLFDIWGMKFPALLNIFNEQNNVRNLIKKLHNATKYVTMDK